MFWRRKKPAPRPFPHLPHVTGTSSPELLELPPNDAGLASPPPRTPESKPADADALVRPASPLALSDADVAAARAAQAPEEAAALEAAAGADDPTMAAPAASAEPEPEAADIALDEPAEAVGSADASFDAAAPDVPLVADAAEAETSLADERPAAFDPATAESPFVAAPASTNTADGVDLQRDTEREPPTAADDADAADDAAVVLLADDAADTPPIDPVAPATAEDGSARATTAPSAEADAERATASLTDADRVELGSEADLAAVAAEMDMLFGDPVDTPPLASDGTTAADAGDADAPADAATAEPMFDGAVASENDLDPEPDAAIAAEAGDRPGDLAGAETDGDEAMARDAATGADTVVSEAAPAEPELENRADGPEAVLAAAVEPTSDAEATVAETPPPVAPVVDDVASDHGDDVLTATTPELEAAERVEADAVPPAIAPQETPIPDESAAIAAAACQPSAAASEGEESAPTAAESDAAFATPAVAAAAPEARPATLDGYYKTPDGLDLYYRDLAPQPAQTDSQTDRAAVLCLHGLTRNGRDYEDLAPRIAALGRRVIIADQRGRGMSDWDANPEHYQPGYYVGDMLGLLDKLDISKVIIVGTSMGGLMSMMLAAAQPGRLVGAVINDIGPEIAQEGLDRIATYVTGGPPATNWADAAARTRAINGSAFPTRRNDSEFWETFARRLFRETPDGRILLDYDPEIARPFLDGKVTGGDLWPFFDALRGVPTLVVRGELSDLLTKDTVAKMRLRKADLQTVEAPAIGHAPFLTEPETWAALEHFFAGLQDV